MAISTIKKGFFYNTYKGAPKAVTVTPSAATDVTTSVTIPAGIYFAVFFMDVFDRLNYLIKDGSNNVLARASTTGGTFCSMFRITESKSVRVTAQVTGGSTSTYNTSNDGNYFGLFLTRLGGVTNSSFIRRAFSERRCA